MTSLLQALMRPLAFSLDPETAHEWAIRALRVVPLPAAPPDDPRLAVNVLGLQFSNPLGVAAGFDKNGEVVDACFHLGFGFTEVGTITPQPQQGNPRPRVFRLTDDQAVINRLGFPSQGHAAVHARLGARPQKRGIAGINLGANKSTRDRAADYVRGVKIFADIADYFTINISSPNTPGLRDLQRANALDDLLARVLDERDKAAESCGRKPVLLKIAPDLTLAELDAIMHCAKSRKIDGLIVANTTVSRPSDLRDPSAREIGGLSGRPIFQLSTQMLAAAFLRAENRFPLIGAGGVDSAKTAFAKIEAGASLVQFYSALVFKGPGLARDIKRGLLPLLADKARLTDAIGSTALDWANGKLSPDNLR
ncbi:dihydroorotate dehydrogenase (quinone) [Beijerinckiaceae bacterium]|nr:dihydroorotate dehydrogenase (quinone) [Beijerinckiaceae bacterium]